MKFELKDIEDLMEGHRPSWIGIIKNYGKFGIKMNGGIIMPSTLDREIYNRLGDGNVYIFKESDFVSLKDYHETKLILLKKEGTYFENEMNPNTGRPIETAIHKPTEIKVGDITKCDKLT